MALEFLFRRPGDAQNPRLARLYGRGSTRGKPCLLGDSEVAGRKRALSFLAVGGRWGCDGLDKVLYEGVEQPEFVGAVRQWRFHPGTRSLGWGDPLQGRPEFFPEVDSTFSGYSYFEGMLPPGKEDPGQFAFFMRGLRTMTYETDSRGNFKEIEPLFNVSPAWAGVDLWREVGRYSMLRLNRWAGSWIEFDDVAKEELAWDKKNQDGSPNVINVPRYDIHVPFGDAIDVTTAFAALMMRCPGASFADLQGALRIYPTPARDHIYRFTFDPTQFEIASNIVKNSFAGAPVDPSVLPNIFFFSYHDIEDPTHVERYITIDRPEIRKAAGGVPNPVGPIPLGLMYESLAQRIGQTMVRLLVDSPYTTPFRLMGQMDSYPIAKASYAWLSHDQIKVREDDPILVRVMQEVFEPKKGEKSFSVIVLDPALDYYRDTDHGPKQNVGYVEPSTLNNGHIVHFSFDEASGNFVDSKSGNVLTPMNAPARVAGKHGNAVQFTAATNHYLTAPDSASLSWGNNDRTIAVWCKFTTIAPIMAILCKGSWGTTQEYWLCQDGDFRLTGAVDSTGGGVTASVKATNMAGSTPGYPDAGVWYLIIFKHDAANNLLIIKVNNSAAITTAHSAGVADLGGAFEVGRHTGLGRYFNGLVDTLDMWNRVTTDAEDTELWNGGAGKVAPF